jgi:phosphatidate cytidylyltransferase
MPLNTKVLKTRALTALIFVAVMAVGLFVNQYTFIALFTIVHFGCWYEFVKLNKIIYPNNYIPNLWRGIFYITLPIALLIGLGYFLSWRGMANLGAPQLQQTLQFKNTIPCAIIFSIWINDTMAYLVGSLIGKRQLSPVSPKKTIEGTAGGIILCTIVMATLAYFLHYNVATAATIAFLCGVFGTIGDLYESKLKRLANVKDSGKFMPGHGGFLDRFDSLLFATPVVAAYLFFA